MPDAWEASVDVTNEPGPGSSPADAPGGPAASRLLHEAAQSGEAAALAPASAGPPAAARAVAGLLAVLAVLWLLVARRRRS